MEQVQTPENHFFNKVSGILKATDEEKIIKTLQSIIDLKSPLSYAQFEILGSVAYMTGLDFISQTTGYNSIVLENVKKRFDLTGISQKVFDKFIEVVTAIDLTFLDEPKDYVKTAILQNAKLKDQKFLVTTLIKKILKETYVPIQFVIETDKLVTSKDLTWMHLLNFNSLFYEQVEINGSTFDDVILLMQNPEFQSSMSEASKRFDDQKYAIIYFDSIISVNEFLRVKPTESNVIFSEEFMTELKAAEELKANAPTDAVDFVEIVEEVAPAEIEPTVEHTETDKFIRGLLIETYGKKIVDTDTFLAAIENVYSDQDLMQEVYKLIKAQHTLNRQNIDEVYGFDCSETITKIEEIFNTNLQSYNSLMKQYVEEIPAEVSSRIVDLVNKTIKSLIIEDKETKSFLLQQVYENQITTYKHLHQTIGLIEKCKIKGQKMSNYVALRDLIIYNDNIVNIFEASTEIDSTRLKMQFYHGFLTFLRQTETVEKTQADLQ